MHDAATAYAVRLASPVDYADIHRIEAAATTLFRDIGLTEAAEYPLLSTEMLARFASEGARFVPWNAPYYARLGFRIVGLDAVGPEHHVVWRVQGEGGLDLASRAFARL